MTFDAQKPAVAKSDSSWDKLAAWGLRAAIALGFITVWVVVCSIGLVRLLSHSALDGQLTPDVLQWTVWPFVVLCASGVVGIGFIANGPRVVDALLAVEAVLRDAPKYARELKAAKEELEAARIKLTLVGVGAAGAVSSQVADAVSSQAANDRAPEAVAPLAERLKLHYERAREQYWLAAQKYVASTGNDIERTKGFLNLEELSNFKEEKAIGSKVAAYVRKVLEIESATRRTGRSNLTAANLTELDHLRDEAGFRQA